MVLVTYCDQPTIFSQNLANDLVLDFAQILCFVHYYVIKPIEWSAEGSGEIDLIVEVANTSKSFGIALSKGIFRKSKNISVERNWVAENNRADAGAELPVGAGILNIGGDDVVIRENTVIGNASFGIASFANPSSALDPRLEPFVDGLVMKRNIAKRNGAEPTARDSRRPRPT